MPNLNDGFELYQWGREATRGTLVAATSKLAVDRLKITPNDAVDRPQIAKGLLVANRGNELVVARGVDWEIPDSRVVFNQLQSFMAMALQGNVASTGVGPYVWTHTRNPAADPGLDARTFELRQSDGATPSDWEFGYGMLSRLEVMGAENEALKFNAAGFGRRLQTSTLTAAQAFPSIVIPPMALSSVYIDDTFAALGTTLIAGQVLGWKWTFESGAYPIPTADARADLDFMLHGYDPNNVKQAMEIVILATAGGQWATEKARAEAAALRAVEIRATVGADILKLQGLFKYTAGSVLPDDSRNGQRIATLRLEGSTDDVNYARSIITNGQQTVI